jgi:CRISPR type IV-associated protein Csf3
MKKIDGIDYGRKFDCQPVIVRARLLRPMVWYDPPTLDGLLAGAVVRDATMGRGVPDIDEAYDIPLPVSCLWRNESGHPLWAASNFWPVGDAEAGIQYQHKRAITGKHSRGKGGRLKIGRPSGRHMERRVPYPTLEATEIEAQAIGDKEEIGHLLESIQFLGKRRNTGLGEVARWEVSAGQFCELETLIGEGHTLLRAVPVGARGLLPASPQGEPVYIGWTPPQWKPSIFSLGWPSGTPLETGADFFSDLPQ